MNPLNLSVYRFNSTTKKWVKLPTTLVSSNATSYTYKTNSPGISIYAISGGYLYSGLNTNTTIPTTATTTVQASSALSSRQLYIFASLAIVLVAIVVIYMYVKRFTSGGGDDGTSIEMPPEH